MADSNSASTETVKYLIYIKFTIAGIVEKSDVIGAIFGQTEGLLGDSLDLRDLQRTSRIGRITVNIQYNKAQRKTTGSVIVPSSLDRVETAVLAASLETVDRVGPCIAKIQLQKLEDVRSTKRDQIVSRATQILTTWDQEVSPESSNLVEEVLRLARISAVSKWGTDNLPAGPDVDSSDTLIIVEGRADILNLLKYGFRNTIAVQGTNIPESVIPLTRKKRTIAFLDGDRGGDLILKELLELAEIDYVAKAPQNREVEELTGKEVLKSLRNRIPIEQILKELESDDNSKGKEKDFYKKDRRGRKEDKRKSRDKRIIEDLSSEDIEIIEEEVDTDDGGSKGRIEDLPKDIQDHINNEVLSELEAFIINSENIVMLKCAVKDLRSSIKDSKENIKGVIFDGVITQRLVDVAEKKKLDYIVGVLSSDIKTKNNNLKIFEFRR